jgi:DNA-binding winged helix-turn-helix (wHTH) protein/Tfp pilus assembly protein PilF
MMGKEIQSGYEFGSSRLDAVKRCLLRDGEIVPLQPKDFETLLVLIRERERVVGKEELIERLWPDTFVEEANLSQHIYVIRKALGDVARENAYIVTVPGRGYRFVAPVIEWREEDEELILAERTRTHLVIEEKEEGQGDREKRRKGEKAFFSRRRLRRIAATAALLVGLGAALAWWWVWRKPERAAVAEIKSVAVLPFKPLNLDGSDEYLGLGMADTLITKLSGLRSLIVRPTGAIRKYIHPEQDPLAAGREQKVDAVLDSSLQRDGERIRVTVRLLSVGDGSSLWTYQCDERYCASIFAMQDAISEKVAAALTLTLTGEERKLLRKRYTENKEAYQAYLKGCYFRDKRTAESIKRAIEHFEQAIELDPHYALAYAGLAGTYVLVFSSVPPNERMPKAKAAATKALELDETLAEAHASLARVKFYDWDWWGAEQEFKRAIELSPNFATAHEWYAIYLNAMRRWDEALAEIKQAQMYDPLSASINMNVGWILFTAGQYDQAITQLQQTIEIDPNFVWTHKRLGLVYLQMGRYEEALAAWKKAASLSGGEPYHIASLGSTYAISGQRSEARAVIAQLQELSRQRYVSALDIARVYAALGEKDQAFAWLQKAYEERAGLLIFLKVDQEFDGLRGDPRFAELLRRMGLTP